MTDCRGIMTDFRKQTGYPVFYDMIQPLTGRRPWHT